MKKTKRGIFGLLLAGMLVCLPALQALAQTYDVSVMDPAPILFPGDVLTGIVTPVTLDGEPLALGDAAPAEWTNQEEAKVYRADPAEDGSILLSLAGYEMTVVGGTSKAGDELTGPIGGHYVNTPEEEMLLDPAAPKEDRAYYPAYTVVTLKAEEPEEGMEFEKWTVDAGTAAVEDETAAETTVMMPEEKVEITANYRPAQTEGAPEGVALDGADAGIAAEGELDPGMMMPEEGIDPGAEITPEGAIDPGAEITPEEGIDPGVEVTPEEAIDPGMEFTPDGGIAPEITIDPGAEVQPQAPADQGMEVTPEITIDPNAGGFPDVSADPGEESGGSILSGVDESAIDIMMGDDYSDLGTIDTTIAEDSSAGGTEGQGEPAPGDPNAPAADGSGTGDPGAPIADGSGTGEPNAEVQKYAVTIGKAADGTEKAKIKSPEIPEGSPVEFEAGAVVTAVADTPAEGMKFTGWTVNPETVQLSAVENAPLEATFTMPAEPVTLTPNYETVQTEPPVPTSGTITVENGLIRAADGSTSNTGSCIEGGMVQLEAAVPAGTRFTGWTVVDAATGAAVGTIADPAGASTTFTMPVPAVANVKITAGYIQMYTVRVSNGLINGTSTELTVDSGTQVTITANANPAGQVFSAWNVTEGAYDLGTAINSPTITVTVNGNLGFAANYQGVEYAVTVNSGSTNYAKAVSGTVVTITAGDAPKGMQFDYWSADSGNVSLADAYSRKTTFAMPAANVTVSAHYKMKEYHVTVQNGYADDDVYYKGDEVTIYSNYPSGGREFDEWIVVDGKASFADASRWETTFTMPACDVTVSATYKDGPSPESNQIQELVEGGEYVTNSTIRFTAAGAGMSNSNPNPGDYRYRPTGYQIGNVTGSWQASPYTTSMSIKARGDYTLKVNYAKEVFDGNNWVADGTTDTRAVNFRVLTPAEAVATGDNTPFLMMTALAGASGLLMLLLLAMLVRRKRNR